MRAWEGNDHFDAGKLGRSARRLPSRLTLAGLILLVAAQALAQPRITRLIVPEDQSLHEKAATTTLVEEAQRRTANGAAITVEHNPIAAVAAGEQVILLGDRSHIAQLLPQPLLSAWRAALAALHPTRNREAFSIITLSWSGGQVAILAGNDERGELFAAGYLLRKMSFAAGAPQLPGSLNLFSQPDKPVRGHQIGYRNKNNTYDAWTLPQFEQQIRDLAIFGANAIQLIAPVSDDDPTSPLFPQPPLETLLGISSILEKYGLDCDLYYPELRDDYTNPATVEAELKDFEALVKAMPRLDALYIPGGDPGHTPPEAMFPLVAREAAILRRYHPAASVWLSAQGFDRARYETFYALLAQHPAWLTGVFFGPQSRDSFFTQRRRVPARYAMQFYPDIGHTMHAQFPVPRWDPIFALTEGREPICPRPSAFAAIYKRFAPLHAGFVTYSEGVTDDVNKIVWTQLGWFASTPVDAILGDYARWFLHREGAQNELAVRAILGLEEDWVGPLAANPQISRTRRLFAALEQSSASQQADRNPRWESLLYRATYDDYLQRKLLRQSSAEARAYAALSDPKPSSEARVQAARAALAGTAPGPEEQAEHDRLFALADRLFHDWGLQLSVKLYHAENWERGANLDRVDSSLTDAPWLEKSLAEALQQPTEAARSAALDRLTHWQRPTPGTLYDDLGDPWNEPHLVRGLGWPRDPELYATAIDGIADRTLDDGWRLSQLTYAETLYETPLRLRYTRLDPRAHYTVRVTYAGEDYALPLALVADDRIEIHAARLRHSNPETAEFAVPAAALTAGALTLKWLGPLGSGGSGRGRQVAEVWLIPDQGPSKQNGPSRQRRTVPKPPTAPH
jgi:hypothetical protein